MLQDKKMTLLAHENEADSQTWNMVAEEVKQFLLFEKCIRESYARIASKLPTDPAQYPLTIGDCIIPAPLDDHFPPIVQEERD
jgi:hypothetical protein